MSSSLGLGLKISHQDAESRQSRQSVIYLHISKLSTHYDDCVGLCKNRNIGCIHFMFMNDLEITGQFTFLYIYVGKTQDKIL